ncbi:hypothetical protein K5M76_03960 [Shewanella xiamenensis]|uniref:hypothetical protein n=1 Tax=Shewanella TaxID=22 RepID=UPI0015E2F487|nr:MULTISPECIES: hypothetical protein [Shewanella]MCT8861498.1 hypothetical protein [Shewanella xiamenensis]MDN5502083.1 hypothetical protein [Shewanella sp.]MDN5529712.1 hypothetical protein [Shewanella sp.]UWG65410.1 hypothetical protein K5M76_03960 [Shewanella xiamenensis]
MAIHTPHTTVSSSEYMGQNLVSNLANLVAIELVQISQSTLVKCPVLQMLINLD